MVAHMNAEARRQDHRKRRGLVLQPLAQEAVEEGRELRPRPARDRIARRLRPGRALAQGRAGGRGRLPHRAALVLLPRGAARQEAARVTLEFRDADKTFDPKAVYGKSHERARRVDVRLDRAQRGTRRLSHARQPRQTQHARPRADDRIHRQGRGACGARRFARAGARRRRRQGLHRRRQYSGNGGARPRQRRRLHHAGAPDLRLPAPPAGAGDRARSTATRSAPGWKWRCRAICAWRRRGRNSACRR